MIQYTFYENAKYLIVFENKDKIRKSLNENLLINTTEYRNVQLKTIVKNYFEIPVNYSFFFFVKCRKTPEKSCMKISNFKYTWNIFYGFLTRNNLPIFEF